MNENSTISLGAFFICYKERNAIEHSVASFFEHYPEAPMYLSSDGGFDYAYLTEKFVNLRTSLDDEQTVGLTVDVSKHTRLHPLFMASFEFLNRVRLAIEFTKTSHLLLMEPDVLVRGKLTIPDAELVGPLPCENEMPEVIQLLIGDWGGKNCRYWGAAAGLMQTRAFIKIYEDLRQQPWILLEALEYDRRIAGALSSSQRFLT